MTTAQTVFAKKLSSLKGNDKLRDHVIDYVLEWYPNQDEAMTFFRNLQNSGCVSGMVGHLIWYTDTVKFYDNYEEEIETLLEDLQNDMGYSNRFETLATFNGAENVDTMTQEKNLLAWFGFEETAYQLALEIFPEEF